MPEQRACTCLRCAGTVRARCSAGDVPVIYGADAVPDGTQAGTAALLAPGGTTRNLGIYTGRSPAQERSPYGALRRQRPSSTGGRHIPGLSAQALLAARGSMRYPYGAWPFTAKAARLTSRIHPGRFGGSGTG